MYDLADIKAAFGLAPHTRGGLFEKLLPKLQDERKISYCEWIIRDRDGNLVERRVAQPSDTMNIIVEYWKRLPEKKQKKYYDVAEEMLHSIARSHKYFDEDVMWDTILKRWREEQKGIDHD